MVKAKNSEAFEFQRRLMILSGFWPFRKPSIFYKIYGYTHYFLVTTFAMSLLISTMVVHDFSQLIQGWSMFVAIVNCSTKFTIFYTKMPAFLDLLDFLKSPHFAYHDEKYDHYLKRIIKIATVVVKMFFCSGITTVFCILSAPMIVPTDDFQTPLPFPANFRKLPAFFYYAVYCYQCVSLFSAAWTSIGFDNLSTSMMGLCSAYFEILKETIVDATAPIKKLIEKNGDSDIYGHLDLDIYQKLSDCVEHHLAVIKFTESIEYIFTYVFLSQFLCSAGGICLVGFTFINSEPGSPDFIFALSFLGTLMFQITLYCSYGNEVTVQSSLIGDACYLSEWIYCGPNVRQSMFLIMERSKRPLILTAGKFFNLSLASLVAIVKSAGSYAAVLFQLINQ